MREVKVTITASGDTQTDFLGFQGDACLAEAERLRQILARFGVGQEVLLLTPKPELSQSQDMGITLPEAPQALEGHI